MGRTLRIGILRETKTPADMRVAFTPQQIKTLQGSYPFAEFFVQPGNIRCYSDEEYENLGIPLREDLSNCDILFGVKEVDRRTFIAGKTYLFFAHVGKKQPHNRDMLREMSVRKTNLIDYEYLTTGKGERVVAFGRWAGIVGAYNGLRAWGIKTDRFRLKPAHRCHDLNEMWAGLRSVVLKPGLKILVTGGGRVASGAMETLGICNPALVTPDHFLNSEFEVPVVCQIGPEHYAAHKKRLQFSFSHFVGHPDEYESVFSRYAKTTDILIAGHYWDPRSPLLFTKKDIKDPEFRISVIADISCDINGSVPSTIRATTIADPFYDYNPVTEAEEQAFSGPSNITVMSIDNLPGELPRDASHDFGNQLMNNILGDLITGTRSPMIERATILRKGELTPYFSYLMDYLGEL